MLLDFGMHMGQGSLQCLGVGGWWKRQKKEEHPTKSEGVVTLGRRGGKRESPKECSRMQGRTRVQAWWETGQDLWTRFMPISRSNSHCPPASVICCNSHREAFQSSCGMRQEGCHRNLWHVSSEQWFKIWEIGIRLDFQSGLGMMGGLLGHQQICLIFSFGLCVDR